MDRDFEVELKLETSPGDLDRLARAPLLTDAGIEVRDQVSTYFDTPDRDLRAAGLSLRVRRSGGTYMQTLKAEGSSAGGLFARPEWENEVGGEQPDTGTLGGPLRDVLPKKALRSLAPIFTVEVTRRIAQVLHEGAEIEVVLDAGQVVAGERTTSINEVELELRDGPHASLFSLARAMDAIVPLRPGVLSKSARGYRLGEGRERKSIKAQVGVVHADMSVAEAFAAICGAGLCHFRLNEAILERTRGAEPLHQARVALRRLRSAVSIFKPVLQDGRLEHVRGELHWLAAMLGDARDIDVLIARTIDQHDLDRLRPAREQAYDAVLAALASDRARRFMIDLSEWIAIGAWRLEPADPALRDLPAEQFAVATLDRLRRRLKRRGRDLLHLADEDRHQVRILAKKMRYTSEFFASLFSGKKAQRRTRKFLAALEGLQQNLGDLNDIAHAPTVRARLGLTIVQETQPVDTVALLRQAAQAHASFSDAKRFWR